MIGQSVGPYRVLGKLGAGGMGEVYLAEDTRLGRKVALKSPSESWLRDPDARARLQREARAAARLNNPRIAAVYDVLDLGDRPYIVMEYVDGETLASRLRRGPLPLERAIAFGIELADALAVAHAAGVIHRDLKPGNIVITEAGALKVLDFGLAKTTPIVREQESATLTHPGQVLGTPGYVAPEQLLGHPADARSDIYAAGAILYEMLTGRALFGQSDSMGRALASLLEPVPRVSDVNPGVPRNVSDVVGRAMAREPQDRFGSAEELRDALIRAAAALGEAPTQVAGSTPRYGVRRRDWWKVAVAVLVLVAVAGVPIAWWWKSRGPVAAGVQVIVVLPLQNATGDASFEYLGAGFADSLVTRLATVETPASVSKVPPTDLQQSSGDRSRLAKALDAAYLIDGSIQKSGERLLVNVRAVAPDNSVVWAGVFEDELANIFDLQRRIAFGVVEGLRLSISPRGEERFADALTTDLAAFRAYSEARMLLDQPSRVGAPSAAVSKFQEAIARDPAFAIAYAGLADALWLRYREKNDAADAKAAITAVERARQLQPAHPVVLLASAGSYEQTGHLDEAVAEVEKLLALQPNNDDAHRRLAGLHARGGRQAEALKHYQRAIAIRSAYWRNHSALGEYYFRTGRYREAAIEFQRVTELQPDDAWAYVNLGAAYHADGDIASAVDNYRRSIEKSPTDTAYSNLGAIYHQQRRYGDAIKAYEDAIRLSPKIPMFHRNLGDAYRGNGDEPAARRAYTRAIREATEMLSVNSKDADTLSLLAVCRAKVGDFPAAREAIGRALQLEPDSGLVAYRGAAIEALAGNAERALALARDAVARGYSRTLLRDDDDFSTLRTRQEFVDLLSDMR